MGHYFLDRQAFSENIIGFEAALDLITYAFIYLSVMIVMTVSHTTTEQVSSLMRAQ